jgi:hypothetical protein
LRGDRIGVLGVLGLAMQMLYHWSHTLSIIHSFLKYILKSDLNMKKTKCTDLRLKPLVSAQGVVKTPSTVNIS